MSEITGYRCPNCGNMVPISRGSVLTCAYCGSQFEKERDSYYHTTFEGDDIIIGTRITGWEMDEIKKGDRGEEFLEYKLKEMAHKLAEALLPRIAIDVSEAPLTGDVLIRGKVRIGRPIEPLGIPQKREFHVYREETLW